jgi:hypothetical protein
MSNKSQEFGELSPGEVFYLPESAESNLDTVTYKKAVGTARKVHSDDNINAMSSRGEFVFFPRDTKVKRVVL